MIIVSRAVCFSLNPFQSRVRLFMKISYSCGRCRHGTRQSARDVSRVTGTSALNLPPLELTFNSVRSNGILRANGFFGGRKLLHCQGSEYSVQFSVVGAIAPRYLARQPMNYADARWRCLSAPSYITLQRCRLLPQNSRCGFQAKILFISNEEKDKAPYY